MTNECYILNLNSDDFPKVEIHRENKPRPGLIIEDLETHKIIYGGDEESHHKKRNRRP